QLDVQLQRVARLDLAAKAGAVEPPEQWQLAGKTGVGQHSDCTDLSDGFAHQDARQRWPTREVARKEPLVSGEMPAPDSAHAGFECDQLVDEQKRRPVWQHIDRRRQRRHSASASNNFVGVSFGLILYQALRIEPSASIRNADRTIPMYVLP